MAIRTWSFSTLLFPAISICISGYFVYHGIYGQYGLVERQRLAAEQVELEHTLSRLQAQSQELRGRIGILNPAHSESVLLEERAREVLGLAQPGEYVVFTPWLKRWQSSACCRPDKGEKSDRGEITGGARRQ